MELCGLIYNALIFQKSRKIAGDSLIIGRLQQKEAASIQRCPFGFWTPWDFNDPDITNRYFYFLFCFCSLCCCWFAFCYSFLFNKGMLHLIKLSQILKNKSNLPAISSPGIYRPYCFHWPVLSAEFLIVCLEAMIATIKPPTLFSILRP